MRFPYRDYKSLFVISKRLTKDYFLEKAGVENAKYAKDMLSRIYDSIFSELIDAEEQYNKYYIIEYSTFRSFLYLKYCIDRETIEDIIKFKAKNDDYRIYIKQNDFSYGDYGIFRFAFSDEMKSRIINLLLMNANED